MPFLRSIGYAGLLIPLAATLATLAALAVLVPLCQPRARRAAAARGSGRMGPCRT